MRRMNRSPLYWLCMGSLFSLSVLVRILDKYTVNFIPCIPGCIAAVACYALAVFFAMKNKRKGGQ